MSIANINVKSAAGRYTVAIGDGLVGGLGSLFPKAVLRGRIFVVSNPLVWRLYGRSLSAGLEDVEPILVPDGERFKQLSTVARVYEALIRRGADRSSVLVALGGGVIGDLAGFAAATYLRGVPLVQIPTTLLAQVDAAIGGKVGVNHALGKNLIGAFYSPRIVIIDPAVLGSLPKRDFRAGLYEVVKYGVDSQPPAVRSSRARPAGSRRARAESASPGHSRMLLTQGLDRFKRRAGVGFAARAELRPYGGSRTRNDHQLPAIPAR